MNFLSMLTNMMSGDNVTGALSNNTNVSSGLIKKLLILALPLLIKKLTSNAMNKDGARSLFDALSQHQTDEPIEAQIANADAEDGAKILGHIFGDSATSEIGSLAQQVGISADQANGVLSNVAPSLLSNLSSVVTNGLPQADTAAPAQQSTGGLFGWLKKLFAKKPEDTSAFDGTNLLSALSAFTGK